MRTVHDYLEAMYIPKARRVHLYRWVTSPTMLQLARPILQPAQLKLPVRNKTVKKWNVSPNNFWDHVPSVDVDFVCFTTVLTLKLSAVPDRSISTEICLRRIGHWQLHLQSFVNRLSSHPVVNKTNRPPCWKQTRFDGLMSRCTSWSDCNLWCSVDQLNQLSTGFSSWLITLPMGPGSTKSTMPTPSGSPNWLAVFKPRFLDSCSSI